MTADLKKLKSGTDIRGTALVKDGLSLNAAIALAYSFADFLGGGIISLGHDSRLSAAALSEAVIEGLFLRADKVYFCGLSSTPAMFMTTVLNDCDGAIMLTASHHPSEKNGIKFFTKEGGVSKQQLDEIIDGAERFLCGGLSGCGRLDHEGETPVSARSEFVQRDFLEDYCRFMREIFARELGTRTPLKGLKICVDAGNGSAGFYAERILKPLGADISGSQFLEPDGRFPFHAPNPEDKTAMESAAKRTIDTKSDLGIIFDTDGDRMGIVERGVQINRNRIIALASAMAIAQEKEQENPKNLPPHIVTDSVTSEGIKEFINGLGGVHVRYKRGYQNVISHAKRLCEEGKNAILAIETSGHAALRENYFLDDGAYLAAKIIIEAVRLKREGKDLFSLIKDLKEPLSETEFRINIKCADFKPIAQNIMDKLIEFSKAYRIADDSHEGIRTYLLDGWFNARMSVHDPVIAVNIESDRESGAREITELVLGAIRGIEGVEVNLNNKL